jgi:hypothetical protein
VGCDAVRDTVGVAVILRVEDGGRIFLRDVNTHRQVNTASHLSTEVLEIFCFGPQVLQKISSTFRAEAIFIPGRWLRRVAEENVLFDFICSTGRAFYHVP